MAKKRNLSAAVIFDTAAKLTEAEGLNGLTIGRLAKELNVKPASLYNHIDGFEDVRRHLAGLAIRELNDAFLQAAAGRSRDDAVLEVALAYRQFAHEHPELYKAFIRSASMKTTEHEAGYALSMQTLKKVLRAYRYPEVELIHLSRGLRSALHGFVSLEAAGFFQGDADVNESFTRMVRMFLDTLKQNEAKE